MILKQKIKIVLCFQNPLILKKVINNTEDFQVKDFNVNFKIKNDIDMTFKITHNLVLNINSKELFLVYKISKNRFILQTFAFRQ